MRKALISIISQKTMQETLQSRRSVSREPIKEEIVQNHVMAKPHPNTLHNSKKSLTELVMNAKAKKINSIQDGIARLQKVQQDPDMLP